MRAAARALVQRVQRVFALGPEAVPERPARPAASQPGGEEPLGWRRTASAAALAVVLPLLVGTALIPLRSSLEQSVSLLMLLPVLVVAALGGAGPGGLAAVAAAATFALLHTRPYYRATISDADDVVETVVLLVIGVTTGLLAQLAHRTVAAARARRRELEALLAFVSATVQRPAPDGVTEAARESLTALLSLRRCEWRPGYHGTVGAVLRPDGRLAVGAADDHVREDVAVLPERVELPVGGPRREHGRFILHSSPACRTSLEERRTAALIAVALAGHLDALPRSPDVPPQR